MTSLNDYDFYGSTTVGKKGQVVIPMETRKKMKWRDGEKILVFGLKNGAVVLTKLDRMKAFTKKLEKRISELNKYE